MNRFGTSVNPGGIYKEAVAAKVTLETSRRDIAALFGALPDEIVFVPGATEANNLAIMGTVKAWQDNHPDEIPHIITTAIEHASVLEPFCELDREGAEVDYLPVDREGRINPRELRNLIKPNTVLVSIAYANGEIGSVEDMRSIAKSIRHARKEQGSAYPVFHTDAVQATLYLADLDVRRLGVDLMTISGAKVYGPKKSAVLYLKRGTTIIPITFGGNQESTYWPGTEDVANIVGLAVALDEARSRQEQESDRLVAVKDYAITWIQDHLSGVTINTPQEGEVLPHIVNLSIDGIDHEELVIRLDAKGIAASVKSACKSGEEGDSHVIRAIAKGDRPTGSIRFSMGRTTTRQDIDRVVKELEGIVDEMNNTYKKYY